MTSIDRNEITFDHRGLVPAIVQDRLTRRVLMMAWMDEEALGETERTGVAHFHSRSRDTLWKKGETSGNTLAVDSITIDCDGDALLVQVEPAGPACHTGARTCWDTEPSAREPGFADLEHLWSVIATRARERPSGSYTTRLLEDGDLAARKVAEEAIEVLMAARDHARGEATDTRVAEEMADLVYHTLALCAERDLSPSLLLEELRTRRG